MGSLPEAAVDDSAERHPKHMSGQVGPGVGRNCNRGRDGTFGGGRGYDAIVVGSGYGGGVSACRLAQAGLKVCIVEKGRRWEPSEFPNNFWQVLNHTQFVTPLGTFGKHTRPYQLMIDRDCLAMTGSGLGGGSLVNAGVIANTPQRARKDPRWPKEWEKDWSTYESKGRAMLEPEPVPYIFPKNRVMDAIRDEIGDLVDDPEDIKLTIRFSNTTNAAGVKQNACIACGNCLNGCRYNAKNSTDKNYIATAIQSGAELLTETKVVFVAENPEKPALCEEGVCSCASWQCGTTKGDPNTTGGHEDKVHTAYIARRWRVYLDEVNYLEADHVILAAGPLGTTEILLRSRQRGLRLSDRLGKGVSCNGNNIAFVSGTRAPTRGAGVNSSDFAHIPNPQRPGPAICNSYTSSAGFTIQGCTTPKNFPYFFFRFWTYGAAAMRWSLVDIIWNQLKVWAQTADSETLTLNMMGYDEGDGEISLDRSSGCLRFTAPRDLSLPKKIAACNRLAKRIRAQIFLSRYRSMAVHLLGGCNAAHGPMEGVADPDGQVFNCTFLDRSNPTDGTGILAPAIPGTHPGLYVCDGSLIPCPIGVNPSGTITTVSERVAAAAVRSATAFSRERARHMNHFKVSPPVAAASQIMFMPGQMQLATEPRDRSPPYQRTPSPVDAHRTPAAVIVRETLRGRLAGFSCELRVVMHMGVGSDHGDEDRECTSRSGASFGDSHRFLRGSVGGTLVAPQVDPEVLHIVDGSVDMCWVDPRTPYTQYMHYHLHLASATGARYMLNGKKEMRPYLGCLWGWQESTTLHVKFQQISSSVTQTGPSAAGPNVPQARPQEETSQPLKHPILEGTIGVSLLGLVKAAVTLRGPQKLLFSKLLVASLVRTYLLRRPRELTNPANQALRPRSALRALSQTDLCPQHVLHKFTTEDGVKVTAMQWVSGASHQELQRTEKRTESTSSNVVLLLNGHSTESYWLPTEPTDLVRTLLRNGYEPWLFNSRLHPLNIVDKQFNLDDIAKYDIPAVMRTIEKVRGEASPVHVVAHCIGGVHIHMAVLGGYIPISKVASILCTNSSMFFRVTKAAMVKLTLPLIPISLAILGKNKSFRTHENSEDGFRHRLLRFVARRIPQVELCTHDCCSVFSGVFGNGFWHTNVTPSAHKNYTVPHIFPMCGMSHLRRIILKGHLVDASGQEIYLCHPERLATPTTYITGGRELLVTQETGRLAYEFMNKHHPEFVHNRVSIPDYGHSDLLMGENSSTHVFPHILEHLERVKERRHLSQGKSQQLQEWEKDQPSSSFLRLPILVGILVVMLRVLMYFIPI